MIRKMLWECFSLVLYLTLSSPIAWCKAPPEKAAHVTISVYNDAGVPAGTIWPAEQGAGRVFREAGIEVNCLNCRVPAAAEVVESCKELVFPTHLDLRIVGRSRGLKVGMLGVAFLAADGSGSQADLFHEPMEQLENTGKANLASLLGHAAAHEVGHLLLGTSSHAPTVIMQAHWAAKEIGIAKLAGLYFTERESKRMRVRLSVRVEAAKLAPQLAPAH